MLILIDNYDSFTYNLYQYLSELGADVHVVRNDKVTVDDISDLSPERIVISPGPGTPRGAGVSVPAIRHFADKGVPILGVCPGHQCIGEAFGAVTEAAGEIFHGKSSRIFHDGEGLLRDLPSPMEAIRYHSLAVRRDSLSEDLKITAWTESKVVMGLRHHCYPIEGVQFHPESIMTGVGKHILHNFLEGDRQ